MTNIEGGANTLRNQLQALEELIGEDRLKILTNLVSNYEAQVQLVNDRSATPEIPSLFEFLKIHKFTDTEIRRW